MIATKSARALVAGAAVFGAVAAVGLGVPSANAAASTPSAAQHTVRTGGVTLSVPAGWHLAAKVPGCIVAPDAKAPTQAERNQGANSCQLQVLTGHQLDSLASAENFYYDGAGDLAQCVRGNRDVGWATASAATVRYPKATYEFRSFHRPCASRHAEQWFAAGPPGVLIQRTFADRATEGAAREAVESATLPAQRIGIPRSVTGLVTGSTVGSVTQVELAPVRLYVAGDGSVELNPIWGPTYRYPVANPASIVYVDGAGSEHTLSQAQFRRDLHSGFPGVGAGRHAVVTLDSSDGAHVQHVVVRAASTA